MFSAVFRSKQKPRPQEGLRKASGLGRAMGSCEPTSCSRKGARTAESMVHVCAGMVQLLSAALVPDSKCKVSHSPRSKKQVSDG